MYNYIQAYKFAKPNGVLDPQHEATSNQLAPQSPSISLVPHYTILYYTIYHTIPYHTIEYYSIL